MRPIRRMFTIPAARRAQANAALERLGYGPDNFCIPLTTPGGTVTRYGCDLPVHGSALAGILRKLQTAAGGASQVKEYSGRTQDERFAACKGAENVSKRKPQ